MGVDGLPGGDVTFLLTDIEGSTRLFRAAGEEFRELLERHHRIVRAAVAAHGGAEVRTQGDSFFCAFASASAALRAALDIQLGLAAEPWPPDRAIRIRVGLHSGHDIAPAAHDYVSLEVHQAARVCDAAHGGQVLCTRDTAAAARDETLEAARLISLGRFRLRDFPEPVELLELRHPLIPAGPPPRALPAAAHNLHPPATLFVGRRTALEELGALVAGSALVTVTGTGGVGKTRLVTELVPLIVDRFPDGAWMVELAHVQRDEEVVGEVLAALGVRPAAGQDPSAALLDALSAQERLLILDNCEHVLDGSAELIERLRRGAPGNHVLTTSREPLGLPGERRFPLAPLRLPGGGTDPEASEAVALFVDRARIVAPDFDPGDERAAIVEICRRLDGLPLAIEIAAARAAALPLSGIAARLDRRFSLLGGPSRGALPHHQTLRASIEWSFDLLDEHERTLLSRLTVFSGEFDLEAVEEVCGRVPLVRGEALAVLSRLVEKSLVQRLGGDYVLLESIREFAREHVEPSEREALAGAHMTHYARFAQEAADAGDGPAQRAAYDRLDAAIANLRSAVSHAIARRDPDALRLAGSLGQYAFVRNRLDEVGRWCAAAVQGVPEAPAALRARALTQAGFAATVQGGVAAGGEMLDEGLLAARAAGDAGLLLDTLIMNADVLLEAGEEGVAATRAREAEGLARTHGNPWLLARALFLSTRTQAEAIGPAEAHRRLREPLELFEQAGDRRQAARTAMTMAYLSLEVGDRVAARAEAERAAEIARELGHPIGLAVVRLVLVFVDIDEGRLDEARRTLAENLAVALESGYTALLLGCLAARAELHALEGSEALAVQVLAALARRREGFGGEGARALWQRLRTLEDALRERLGEDRFAARYAEGAGREMAELAAS